MSVLLQTSLDCDKAGKPFRAIHITTLHTTQQKHTTGSGAARDVALAKCLESDHLDTFHPGETVCNTQ
jgi:hypothetical protein